MWLPFAFLYEEQVLLQNNSMHAIKIAGFNLYKIDSFCKTTQVYLQNILPVGC